MQRSSVSVKMCIVLDATELEITPRLKLYSNTLCDYFENSYSTFVIYGALLVNDAPIFRQEIINLQNMTE